MSPLIILTNVVAFGFPTYRYTKQWFSWHPWLYFSLIPTKLSFKTQRPRGHGPSGIGLLPGETAKVERQLHKFQRIDIQALFRSAQNVILNQFPGTKTGQCPPKFLSGFAKISRNITVRSPLQLSIRFHIHDICHACPSQRWSVYNRTEVINIIQKLATQIYRLKGKQF